MSLRESPFLNEFMAEAQAECVRQVLEVRFGRLPDRVTGRIADVRHRPALREWLSVAVRCADPEDFLKQIASLAVVLKIRFGFVPADIAFLIAETSDVDKLNRWAVIASHSASLTEFRSAAGL